MLSTAIAYSIVFFSVDPRVVLVMAYMAEFRFHNPIYNSATFIPDSRVMELLLYLEACQKTDKKYLFILIILHKPFSGLINNTAFEDADIY